MVNPDNVRLPPAVAEDPKQVCGLIQAALQNNDETRAVGLAHYLPANLAQSDEARNLFLYALQFGSVKVSGTLLQDGLSPDLIRGEDDRGLFPPLLAALKHPESAVLLLKHGANPRLLDRPECLFLEQAAASISAPGDLPELLKSYPALDTKVGYGTLGGTALCAVAGRFTYQNPYQTFGDAVSREKAVRFLLAQGVSPSSLGREGYSALHAAFGWRDGQMACLLAGLGADPHCRDLAGRMVLDAPYLSSEEGGGFEQVLEAYEPASDTEELGKARLLEAIHARPTLADLRAAVIAGDLARVTDLLNRGASLAPPYTDTDAPSADAGKPGLVFLAVKQHAREIAETLLAHGCDPNIGALGVWGWDDAEPPFSGSSQALQGCPRLIPQDQCETPLIAAAEAGDLAMVKLLLKHGAYAPTQDQFHRNAIEAAATPEIAQYIKERTRAQFAAQELFDALDTTEDARPAAFAPIAPIAQTTPEAFAMRNAQGFTPLTYPYRGGAGMMAYPPDSIDNDALAYIHKCGTKLTGLDDFGMTPLHGAVLYARAKEVAALVNLGFDPNMPDARGITPADLAKGILDDSARNAVLSAFDPPPTQ